MGHRPRSGKVLLVATAVTTVLTAMEWLIVPSLPAGARKPAEVGLFVVTLSLLVLTTVALVRARRVLITATEGAIAVNGPCDGQHLRLRGRRPPVLMLTDAAGHVHRYRRGGMRDEKDVYTYDGQGS